MARAPVEVENLDPHDNRCERPSARPHALPGPWPVRIVPALPIGQRLAGLLTLPLSQRAVPVMQPEEARGNPPLDRPPDRGALTPTVRIARALARVMDPLGKRPRHLAESYGDARSRSTGPLPPESVSGLAEVPAGVRLWERRGVGTPPLPARSNLRNGGRQPMDGSSSSTEANSRCTSGAPTSRSRTSTPTRW